MRSFARSACMVVLLAFGVADALPAAAAAKTEKAQFKLVIEGDAYATRTFNVKGSVALCQESVSGTFRQDTTYLRGKGVVLDFVRKKAGSSYVYGAKRGKGPADFTVVSTSERTATGSDTLLPSPGLPEPLKAAAQSACNISIPDLGTQGACKVKRTTHDDMGLKIVGNTFSVVPAGDALAAPLGKGTCGETVTTKGFVGLLHEWPTAIETDFKAFPDAKMFNPRINAVAVLLSGAKTDPPEALGTPPLTGTSEQAGGNSVTVRFIRCGERKRPAC